MNVQRILAIKGNDIVTIPPHRTMMEAARLLAEKRIGAIVVTGAEGTVLGILSERDIVRTLATGVENLEQPVSKFMTQRVRTCSPQMPIIEVMDEMTKGRFRHLPVVETGRLTGIVSIGDVVKHRLEEIEAETRAMRDYIATA